MTRIDAQKVASSASNRTVLKVSWLIAAALLRQLSTKISDRLARDLSR